MVKEEAAQRRKRRKKANDAKLRGGRRPMMPSSVLSFTKLVSSAAMVKEEAAQRRKRRKKANDAKLSAVSHGESSSFHSLDQQLWRHLPADLVQRVLCSLPLPALVRARLLCKTWNAELSSFLPTFKHSCLMVPGFGGFYSFDPYQNRWFRVPYSLEEIPCKEDNFRWAASGGLFCLLSRGDEPVLVVGNPLTRQWRMLPPFPIEGCCLFHCMTADSATGAFKVMVMDHTQSFWRDGEEISAIVRPLVFDSTSGSWERRARELSKPYYCSWRTILINGTLYSVSRTGRSLLSCNLDDELWNEVEIQESYYECEGRFPVLVECQGRLFLVARLNRQCGLTSLKPQFSWGRLPLTFHNVVGIWELHCDPYRWELLSYTPEDFMEDIVASSDGTDILVASDGHRVIWLVFSGSPMMAFDIVSEKWSLQPGCPSESILYTLDDRKALFAPLI